MLWYCRFEWQPGVTRQQVAERVVQQHEAGNTHPERIKGWYNLAGGGAGFLLVETQRPQAPGAKWSLALVCCLS
jgi:hypothetical protein